MAGTRVRGLADLRRRLALEHPARGVRLLCLLCCSRSRAAGIFLPLHAGGVLWAPASAFVATLLRLGGDLCPPLRDVHRRAAINPPLLAIPRAVLGREGDEPDWHLLLPAPS
jgi:hypothetical protein